MTLYLVKDGIENIGWKIDYNKKQILYTNYYLITYDFKSNEGYIEKKQKNYWSLYTQVGQKVGETKYHKCTDFSACVEKLKILKGDNDIVICCSTDIAKYITLPPTKN